MKSIFKLTFLSLAFAPLFMGCVEEDDIEVAPFRPLIFSETFEEVNNNQPFDYPGWTNFVEAGNPSKKWVERYVSNMGFILFNPHPTTDVSNIAWAITPAINLDQTDNERLTFETASNFVTSPNNKIEILISTNYDGTDVLAATWEPLEARVADNTTNGYVFIPSGEIDLSSYSGNIHIAFRVIGGQALAGLYEVDNIKVYSAE